MIDNVPTYHRKRVVPFLYTFPIDQVVQLRLFKLAT